MSRATSFRTGRFQSHGFSLLEMLVALTLLGLILGGLYQASTGATRNVRVAERYSYAVLLAQSLLADHGARATRGYRAAGSSGDYDWRISTAPVRNDDSFGEAAVLHRLSVSVRWDEGAGRSVDLTTVAPIARDGQ